MTTLLACAVCFDPNAEPRIAFLATALFLTFLPLGMVGGMGFWLWKRAQDVEEEGEEPAGIPEDIGTSS